MVFQQHAACHWLPAHAKSPPCILNPQHKQCNPQLPRSLVVVVIEEHHSITARVPLVSGVTDHQRTKQAINVLQRWKKQAAAVVIGDASGDAMCETFGVSLQLTR
jgi:hypothetical protein